MLKMLTFDTVLKQYINGFTSLDVIQFNTFIRFAASSFVNQHTSCIILKMKLGLVALICTLVVGHTRGYYVVGVIKRNVHVI